MKTDNPSFLYGQKEKALPEQDPNLQEITLQLS